MNDQVALLIPSLGTIDLEEMLISLGANRFDEVIVAIDLVGRKYLPEDKKVSIHVLRDKYPWVRFCENEGKPIPGSINQTVNEAYYRCKSDWIWITHEDILFPQQIAPHPNYRYDLRLATEIAGIRDKLGSNGLPIKSIMFHYYQIPNKLDTRMFAHIESGRYVSDLGGGGGNTGISSVIHRSIIESIEKYHPGKGFDLEYCTYYDTQIIADSVINPWTSIAIHDAPAILHKVSAAGRYTSNCNDFEPNKKWKNIVENANAWRDHVQALGRNPVNGKRAMEGTG